MPKIFDYKKDYIDDIKTNKCFVVEIVDITAHCDMCEECNKIVYKCLDCRHTLCKFCMLIHVIRENKLYQCEVCNNVYDLQEDVELIRHPRKKDYYVMCPECKNKLKC